MAYSTDAYITDRPAAAALPAERATFIRKTYGHVAGAVAATIVIETALIMSGIADTLLPALYGSGGKLGVILLMVAFMAASYVARMWANNGASRATQYAGLGLYVVVQSIILLPLLWIAHHYFPQQNLIPKAGLLTGGLFLGLTTAVFVTRADFSFMRAILPMAMFVMLLTAVAGLMFGFTLGLWFTVIMILLAAGYLVYDTSNVLHHYPTTHYVGASLELFASIAMLFYYILRFAMQMTSRD